MDPIEALRRWREALEAKEPYERGEYAAALNTWLNGGGFKPSDMTDDERRIVRMDAVSYANGEADIECTGCGCACVSGNNPASIPLCNYCYRGVK